MIKVLFFARLRDQLQCNQLELMPSEVTSSAGKLTNISLVNYLCDKNPAWREYLLDQTVFVAVNQEIIHEETVISANDEIAFFPPVTGG